MVHDVQAQLRSPLLSFIIPELRSSPGGEVTQVLWSQEASLPCPGAQSLSRVLLEQRQSVLDMVRTSLEASASFNFNMLRVSFSETLIQIMTKFLHGDNFYGDPDITSTK